MSGTAPREGTSILHHLRQLGGQSVVYGFGLAATYGLGFLLLPIVSRFMAPAEYGVAAVMTSVGGLLAIFFTLSLDAAALRHYRAQADERERRGYIGAIFLFVTAADLLLVGLLCAFGGPVASMVFGESGYAGYLRLVVLSTFFQVGGALPLAILRAQEKPVPFLVYGLGSAVLSRGMMLALVIVWRQTALAYLLGVLIGNAAFYLIFVRFVLGESSFVGDLRARLAKALSFSLPLVPHQLSHWVLGVIDRIMLQRLLNVSAAGIYSAGNAIGLVMNLVVVQGINYAWVPYLYRLYGENREDADQTASSLMTHIIAVTTLFGLVLSLASPEIIRLMVAPAYYQSRDVVPLTVAAYWAVGLYHIPVSFLFLRERTKVLPLLTASAALINVAANFVLIPPLGIIGPALGKFIGFAVLAVGVTITALKLSPFPCQWSRVARICLTGVAMGVLGEWVIRQGWGEGLSLLARTGLLLGFFGLLLALGAYRVQDLSRAAKYLRRRSSREAG